MKAETVSALAYSLAGAMPRERGPDFELRCNEIARFLLSQSMRLPDWLQTPMHAATVGFDLLGCLRGGQLFHRQFPEKRAAQIAAWKSSKLSFQRDFIRYYESLAALALHSADDDPRAANLQTDATGVSAGNIISNQPPEMRCEIAVIGSGPGGAVTACLLAEAGRSVLLIEEGPFEPLESCTPFSRAEMIQKYRNGGQTVALGRNKIAYVEGRCVGGGSEINSGLYHRTPPDILETWRTSYQVEGLSEADLEPHFEANERALSVSLSSLPPPEAARMLADGAARLGWKSLEVPRWWNDAPASTSAIPGRQTMTRTFIPRFLKAGGRLLPSARIERLRRDGNSWSLLGRARNSGALRILAETVFVSAGAVHTPTLLRRSGITQNIGNSLRLHPTLKLTARFSKPVNRPGMGVPSHQVKEFAPRLSFGCSISSPAYLAVGLLDHPGSLRTIAEDWTHLASYYAMICGEGHGTVRTVPGFRDPLVRYHLTANDRRDLTEGARKLSQLLFEAGAVEILPAVSGSESMRSADDIRKLPGLLPDGAASLMTIHLMSSCPMGEDRSRCATDSFGRVHGTKGLFIADASLLCTAPGVNPQGSIMAIAARNALRFLGK